MAKASKTITVENITHAPIEKVWAMWTGPSHIVKWCHASDDWEAPSAENDMRIDGKFKTVMAAKDGSARFDFEGTYTNIQKYEHIEYVINDGRKVILQFEGVGGSTKLTETFEIEHAHSEDQQRASWQAILDNFKKYAEVQSWIKKLEREGFTDVRVCPIPPNQDLPEHTHDEHTVHVILNGELTITDTDDTKVFRPGDRVEFPAGTTHKARGATDGGTMIIGVKTN